MSHTRAVWLFVLALTGIRFTMLGTSDLSFDEAHYWMWSDRLAVLESDSRRGDESAPLLFHEETVQRARCILERHRAQRHPAFQRRQSRHDYRSTFDLFLGRGHVHFLARA